MPWIPRYGRMVRRAPVDVAADAEPDAPETEASGATDGESGVTAAADESAGDLSARPQAVVIPEDWRSLAWNDLRSLAAGLAVDDAPVKTKSEAVARIEAELATRAVVVKG